MLFMINTGLLCFRINVAFISKVLCNSVATKIENGPKMNTKILRFLKIDQRRRIFLNSKILRRLQILRRSSKIRRFSKENEKFSLLKFSFRQQLRQIFPAVELSIMWGKLKFKILRKVHISELFQTIFSKILLNFPKKIFAIFSLKSLQLRRLFSIWKWTKNEDKDGSLDKNL